MRKLFKTMFMITLVLVLLFAVFVIVSVVSAGNSIGIIGGADGPTAIFITRTLVFTNPVFWLLCFVAVLFIASAIGWFITRNK